MKNLRCIPLALLAACLTAAPLCACSQASPFTVLHQFSQPVYVGVIPHSPLIQATDGNFYGTTTYGGDNNWGTVFKVTPEGILTTLYSFAFTDGEDPEAGLVQGTDGNFYGTTAGGGTSRDGTVFKITPGGVLTSLHSFAGIDGSFPNGLIQASDGNLYGTTFYGGANGKGTVFKITPAGTLTTLYSFSGTDGANPAASLIQASDGNLYGTTASGGANNTGTVFQITPTGTYTLLYSFSALSSSGINSDGATPNGLVVGNDGDFYGTAAYGGANGSGTIFKITPTGSLTTLYTFSVLSTESPYGNTDGGRPLAGLVQGSDGNFYGVTSRGGNNNNGTIFKMTPAGAFTVLHTFSSGLGPSFVENNPLTFANADGANPQAPLIQGKDGNLYGTAADEGAFAYYGTIFKINPSGVFSTLYAFNFGINSDGGYPNATPIQGRDGNFYGTASIGGDNGQGTVYKLSPTGVVTTLHSFLGLDGSGPAAAPVEGSDGNFYGTTQFGGAYGYGAIFKMSPTGALTTIYSFSGFSGFNGIYGTNPDGASPVAALVEGSDGNFYGTTQYGGSDGRGVVFKITPSGTMTTLHTFSALGTGGVNADGANPTAPLLQYSDGNFYGTAYNGGANGWGTVFKITPTGAFTTLFSFNPFVYPYGGGPTAGLITASDDNFYGTTLFGPPFRMTPTGAITGFTAGNGSKSALVLGPDGNFYGTTSAGGTSNGGTIFKLTPTGAVSVLFNDPGTQLYPYPLQGLLLGSDGNFYGTTEFGGITDRLDRGLGVIFRFELPALLLQNPATGQLAWWRFATNVQSGGAFLYPKQAPGWKVAGIADFNRDGQPDLLFWNPVDAHLALWYLSANYFLSGAAVSPTQDPDYTPVGVGDFNGDGQPDILFQNPATGQLALWYMNGSYLSQAAFVYPVQSPAWKVVGVGDFDGDGTPDILFQNASTGQLAIWYMNNNYQASAAFVYPSQNPAWRAVGVVDMNWDGKPDILFQNTCTGQLAVWYMDNNYAVGGALIYPALPAGWQVAGTH